MSKKIFIIAGEASGDLHAAKLIQETKLRDSSLSFVGIGGAGMRASGAEILIDSAELSVMGFLELIPHLWTIYCALKTVESYLKENKPDLLVLIDFSGFNLKVAKIAKKIGIKVLYYISPQVWAWRSKRVELIRKYVDMMAVIYPFEFDFYQARNIPVRLIRNPLLDHAISTLTPQQAREKLNLDIHKKTVGLLPGSRRGEIKYLLPLLLGTAEKLHTELTNVQFVLPRASTLKQEDIAPYINQINFPLQIVEQQTQTVLSACDAVIATSGTVTLQAALQKIPMAIVYRLSPITFSIIRHLIKLPYIGLCNIVAEKKVVKEFIQDDANVENVAEEIKAILTDDLYVEALKQQLFAMRQQLENLGSNQKIADVVIEMLM